MPRIFPAKFHSVLWLRACGASLVLALMALAAPRLGSADTPELPLPDGSGDTPEMIVKLVSPNVGPVNRPATVKLSSLRGKIVLLDMFWSKCSHCEEHAPHVVEWYNQYKMRGFTVLGLATDQEKDVASVRDFMKRTKINYPVGHISNMLLAYYADSHDHGVPQMVLFGPDGKMVLRKIGWRDDVSKAMKQAIEEQVGKLATVKPGSKASAKPTTLKLKQV